VLLFVSVFVSNSYVNPTQGVYDSPDPGVLRDVDGTYYAITTGRMGQVIFPIWKSKDLGAWANVGFGFKVIPVWTNGGDYWAP